MYMDGTGIQERTARLTDKMWDTLTLGIFGAWIIFVGPFASWMFIIHRFSRQPPTTEFDWGLAIIITVATVVVGLKMHLPHHRARTALRRHRKNMERVSASEGYLFSDSYFADLRTHLGDHWHLCTVLSPNGEVAAAGSFTVANGIAQGHLGAASPRQNR